MNNNDDRKPAPSVAPLDATQLEGAMHLLDADEMARALDTHAARAMLFGDAPTSAPVQAEIDRLNATYARVEYRDCATAPATPTPDHGHITDADAARDTQDDQADAAVAGVLARVQQELRELEAKYTDLMEKNAALREAAVAKDREHTRVSSEAAGLHEQRDSLWRQNVALIRGGQPVHEFDMSFHAEDAAYAVQRAQMLEAEGAHTAPRWARDTHGRITGLDVLHLAAVADIEPVGMAVTDGGDVVDEQRRAA